MIARAMCMETLFTIEPRQCRLLVAGAGAFFVCIIVLHSTFALYAAWRKRKTDAVPSPEKARFVLGLMEGRLTGLGASWSDVTVANIYTVHDLPVDELTRAMGPAVRHGMTWHYTRPPIVTIEFEMDLRGVASALVL